MERPQLTGLKKREQIKNANQAMFLWVIIASVAVAVCIVLGQFMVRQMLFNGKIIDAKEQTLRTLKQNKQTFEGLKQEVNKLTSNKSLADLRIAPDDTALQVIIDALPTADDRAALATSLQQIVLSRSGVAIETINVIDASSSGGGEGGLDSSTPGEIPFNVVVNGNYDQIRQAIRDMEHTIRPISVDRVQIEGNGSQLRASIAARTYFLPAKTVENKTEMLKP